MKKKSKLIPKNELKKKLHVIMSVYGTILCKVSEKKKKIQRCGEGGGAMLGFNSGACNAHCCCRSQIPWENDLSPDFRNKENTIILLIIIASFLHAFLNPPNRFS